VAPARLLLCTALTYVAIRLCGEALDRLAVAWRFSRPDVISVARREAVARLDEFVGPKY
jgi:hypothetical protein